MSFELLFVFYPYSDVDLMYDVLMYSCGMCMPCFYPHLSRIWYDVMISTLQKCLQYATLSLVGPSSSFWIGSHIGRDKLVIRASTDHRSPLDCWSLLSLEKNYFES